MARDVIVVGSAAAVNAALQHGGAADLRVVGAVVIGPGETSVPTLDHVATWHSLKLEDCKAQALLLAEPPPNGAAARAVLERAAAARLQVLLLEDAGVCALDLHDLLGTPLGDVDWARIRAMIAGKRVLVTGGGGSIGGELARRIASLAPERLTLLDSSEHNLYQIGLELRGARTVLCDIRDEAAVRRWFAKETPQIVFHTAALKQVPVVEAFPGEGVLTNIGGLRNVVEAAHWVGADLIFVSTDKAVEPSGAMGATKRFGELYCQALDRRGAQRAIPVRLGNVLGSAGSVAPLFEAQLAAGGPLTVTHADMTRYFLSIPQAADALLQAAAKGLSSERRGAVKVIEMGEALPVVELARSVIRLAGKRPDEDVPIVFTGLRPGEKMHERLIARDEWPESDAGSGVIAAMSQPRDLSELNDLIERLVLLARQGADEELREALFAAISAAEETELAAAG
ncbi:MAG TPA: polysaccharide biosynthesis protein [Candidatus Binatia bacterium]|nr:polysaccharide biosynthesis protein [Candidatus Binatia bacterium]